MPDVDTFCALVTRLTGVQRSLLLHLPGWGSMLFVTAPLMQVGYLRGLHVLGLVERHPVIVGLFQRSQVGEWVAEALLDTEAPADAA